EDRSGRQLDVLALGRGDRAAAADEDPEQRSLAAADDATDDPADGAARADLADLTLDAFALDRLRHRSTDRVAAPLDGNLVERHRHAAFAIRPRGLVDRADDAAHHRPGWDQHAVAAVEVHHRGGLEPLFDLGGVGIQLVLQPHVELLSHRDGAGSA